MHLPWTYLGDRVILNPMTTSCQRQTFSLWWFPLRLAWVQNKSRLSLANCFRAFLSASYFGLQTAHKQERFPQYSTLLGIMDTLSIPFPAESFVWIPWRRVWYLARVEETREAERGIPGDVELLIHVHGEPTTKDKWMTVHRDGTTAAGTPPLQLLEVLPTALTGIGSLPAVGNRVQLLVMDQTLVQLIASRRTEDLSAVEMPTLVGIVVKVLPARDASLVDVAYPTELVGQTPDEAQWQRVQISNGYLNVISESRFAILQQQLDIAIASSS